jgi:hypothetical protein
MTSKIFEINDGLLFIANNHIDTPFKVEKVVYLNDQVIALMEPPAKTAFNRNIISYSTEGNLLWQIQESPHGTQIDKPYTSLHINDHKQLIAGNWNGVDYAVDLENGIVTAAAFDK